MSVKPRLETTGRDCKPRVEPRSDDDFGWVQTFGTGMASVSHFSSRPTVKQLKKWAKEDAARDKRRTVPFGFGVRP